MSTYNVHVILGSKITSYMYSTWYNELMYMYSTWYNELMYMYSTWYNELMYMYMYFTPYTCSVLYKGPRPHQVLLKISRSPGTLRNHRPF